MTLSGSKLFYFLWMALTREGSFPAQVRTGFCRMSAKEGTVKNFMKKETFDPNA